MNDGWRVAQTTLLNERNSVAGGGLFGLVMARSGSDGDLDRKVGEVVDRAREAARARKSPLSAGAVPAKVMVELAQTFGVSDHPVVRQELTRYISQIRVNGWTMRRIGAAGGSSRVPTAPSPSSRRPESASSHGTSPTGSSERRGC